MQQVAAHQRALLFWISGQYATAEPVLRVKSRTALKHYDGIVRQTPDRGSARILHFHSQEAARAEKVFVLHTGQDIFHRQTEVIDGKQRRIVEGNQRAA